jgi:hypothetical protein
MSNLKQRHCIEHVKLPVCIKLWIGSSTVYKHKSIEEPNCDWTLAVKRQSVLIPACTVVQCSIMDDSAFLWKRAIFGPPPHRNPLTDRYKILHN